MADKAHTIEIVIGTDGKVTSEVKGVMGPDCAKLTAWLDELGSVEVDKHTGDWYKHGEQNLTNRR